MRGVDLVEQGHGIALDRLFGGRAGTATVASVVHQVERMIGEGPGEPGQAAGHVLGIAAEIDQRLGAVPRAYGNQHLRVVDRQGEQRSRGVEGAWLRVVDEGALEHEQRHTEHQVQRWRR